MICLTSSDEENAIYTFFSPSQLQTSEKQSIMDLKTVNYKAPTIWAKFPSEYKLASFLKEFKVKIKTWKCDICPCRLCKTFQPNIGFVKQGAWILSFTFGWFFFFLN